MVAELSMSAGGRYGQTERVTNEARAMTDSVAST